MAFDFVNDEKSQAFCEEIVRHLTVEHHLEPPDAHRYVALQWAGQPFEGEYDLRYHQLAEEWAGHIFKYHGYLFGDAGIG